MHFAQAAESCSPMIEPMPPRRLTSEPATSKIAGVMRTFGLVSACCFR